MTARGDLFAYAAQRADRDGLCFVHPVDDGPPTHVVMTADRYRDLTARIFLGSIPESDPEWQHDHATPQMLADELAADVLDWDNAVDREPRKEPPLLRLEDGTIYRVKHMRLLEPLPLSHLEPITPKMLAKGGKTVVEIVADDGATVLATGVAICRANENYNRRLGRTIALGRAQKQLRALTTA